MIVPNNEWVFAANWLLTCYDYDENPVFMV